MNEDGEGSSCGAPRAASTASMLNPDTTIFAVKSGESCGPLASDARAPLRASVVICARPAAVLRVRVSSCSARPSGQCWPAEWVVPLPSVPQEAAWVRGGWVLQLSLLLKKLTELARRPGLGRSVVTKHVQQSQRPGAVYRLIACLVA